MNLQILKSKLHRVTITNTHLDYEGSCAIDSEILKVAQINEYEMIHIYNLQNGERLFKKLTYHYDSILISKMIVMYLLTPPLFTLKVCQSLVHSQDFMMIIIHPPILQKKSTFKGLTIVLNFIHAS